MWFLQTQIAYSVTQTGEGSLSRGDHSPYRFFYRVGPRTVWVWWVSGTGPNCQHVKDSGIPTPRKTTDHSTPSRVAWP